MRTALRASFLGVIWVGTICVLAGGVRGDIAYHFMPGVEGQVRGFVQFAEIAPQYGPKDFKVVLSGAMIGSEPSSSPTTARVYLDKWGVGILNPVAGRDVGIQGQVQIDGKRGGEYVRMDFPTPVRLTLLTFASVNPGEDVDILANGVPIDLHGLFPGTKTIRDISTQQRTWPGTMDFTQAVAPTTFAKRWEVFVRSSAYGDGIQLENVNVEAVPEPSTILLSAMGLGAVGIWSVRRRRR